MTHADIEQIAKVAAREAVTETLQALGFDTTRPLEIQKNQAFLTTMRTGTQSSIAIAIKTLIGLVVTFVAGWLWLAFNRH